MAHFSIRQALQALLGLAATAAAVPQGAAGSGSNPTFYSDSTFQAQMLNSTNTYRQMYGASSLTWDDSLASYAQNAANSCVFKHTGGPYGENIAEGYASTTDTCQAWGDERFLYSWSAPGFAESTGHFTQLVWKDSTKVGCGRTFCGASSGWYVVCEYQPAGNVIGSFAGEVGTLVSGSATRASSSSTPTQTIPPMQIAAQATTALPMFTGAADRNKIGSGMAMVGMVGALVAWT